MHNSAQLSSVLGPKGVGRHQGLSRILITARELIQAVVTHNKQYAFLTGLYCACDGLRSPVTFGKWCIGVTISL